MRKIVLLVTSLLWCFTSLAQNGNAVFFSENGEKFTVIINGLRKNDQPETNVKITGLNEAAYMVKIIFADTSLGFINDKIYPQNYKEKTYSVRARKISSAEKGISKVGVNLGRQLKSGDKEEAAKKKEDIDNTDSKYVIKLISESNLDAPAETRSQPTGNSQKPSNNQATSNTTTNTTSSSTNASIQASENGFSMNVNISDNSPSQTTTTTTTNTTSSNSGHYQMPGYNGPVGCSWPMSTGDFEAAKKSISEKSFEESKVTIAKQIIGSNCLISSQVKEIMLLFQFEESRLDFAKYAYGYTYDIGNYYKVNDAFTFESSIDDLNSYIEARK